MVVRQLLFIVWVPSLIVSGFLESLCMPFSHIDVSEKVVCAYLAGTLLHRPPGASQASKYAILHPSEREKDRR